MWLQELFKTFTASCYARSTTAKNRLGNIVKHTRHIANFPCSGRKLGDKFFCRVNGSLIHKSLQLSPQKEIETWKIWRARWPSYRTTSPNPFVWKAYVQIVSHSLCVMSWCSILLKPHYTPDEWRNFVQHVWQHLLQKREVFIPIKAFWKKIRAE